MSAVKSQQRRLAHVDEQLKSTQDKINSLKQSIKASTEQYRKELLKKQVNGLASRKLKKLKEQLEQLRKTAATLRAESSGNTGLEEGLHLQGDTEDTHDEQGEWCNGMHGDTMMYYKRSTLEVNRSIITDQALNNSSRPPQTSSTAKTLLATHDPAFSARQFANPITNATVPTIRFREFVPDVVKWYG